MVDVAAALDPRRSSAARPLDPGGRPGRRGGATIGPAALISAGYVDPGNWGADIAAGHEYGLRLIWVLAAAMVVALFFQQLAARVGLATGLDLATVIRLHLPRPVRYLLAPPILLALAVTEIVELIGVVVGVQLLSGWPVTMSLAAAAVLVTVVLCAPPAHARAVIYGCLILTTVVYLGWLAQHHGGGIGGHMVPGALPHASAPVAAALIGSVVMPHNILLHSALARDLARPDSRVATDRLLRRSAATGAVTLVLAFAVNAAITAIATDSSGSRQSPVIAIPATFTHVTAALFALTLLSCGLAAATTGGMATADVVAHLIPGLHLPATTRRLLGVVLAVAVCLSPIDTITALLWSQVLLVLTLPAVLLPLLWCVHHRRLMGVHRPHRRTRITATCLCVLLIGAGLASLGLT